MACRTKGLMIVAALMGLGGATAHAQDIPPQLHEQRQKIERERPREAEAAARAFLHALTLQQEAPFQLERQLAELDSLKQRSPDHYWNEVALLTVQFEMVQNLVRRDSTRADLVTKMFGTEVSARGLQREYRGATEARRALIRRELEQLIDRHFGVEEKLREREVADIERRLAQVRAESQKRRDKRGEIVKWAVDDIIRDATRPE